MIWLQRHRASRRKFNCVVSMCSIRIQCFQTRRMNSDMVGTHRPAQARLSNSELSVVSRVSSSCRQSIQKSQPGGNFVLGPRNFHRRKKHHYHRSRNARGTCSLHLWRPVLDNSLFQPKACCCAEKVERDRPGRFRAISHCRWARTHRQSSGGSCDCLRRGASTPNRSASTNKLKKYRVFFVRALEASA